MDHNVQHVLDENITVKYDDVLIGCEGNFGWGNASISLYNPTDNSITNTIFQNINGYAIGDVLQSITEYNGKLFVVVNNSGKYRNSGHCYLPKNGYHQRFDKPSLFLWNKQL